MAAAPKKTTTTTTVCRAIAKWMCYAVLALLNHTAYDVQFAFAGFEYTVRAHETHHRYPTTNLAQYFMIWDKLMGTYKPYYDGADRLKKRLEREARTKAINDDDASDASSAPESERTVLSTEFISRDTMTRRHKAKAAS